jgi:folate-binding protein YgfZ
MFAMAVTALTETLKSAGARIGSYNGAETASGFADVASEFSALMSAAGVFDLGWRAKLILTGGDRQKWLNGMVTNNIRDLAPGHGTYNFLLNAQGHIMGDMYLYNRGDYILLDTDASQAQTIRTLLDKFIIMDDVEISDASEKLTAIGIIGPKAHEVLAAAGISIPALVELQIHDAVWQEAGVSIVSTEHGRVEIWLGAANAPRLWDTLVAAGAKPVGAKALELWRIAQGIPQYGKDIRERDLPQETEQPRALNFIKGCYVGQEIVERIRSRGAVHRHFTGFEIEGPPPTPGTKVQADGKDSGEITSVASLPSGQTIALGYVRKEAGPSGTVIEAGAAKARIIDLPFTLEAALRQ